MKQAFWPYLLGGVAAGMGIFLFTSSLQLSEVFRVVPLVQISPLFTVLFSVIFLRRAEFITWRVPAGAVAHRERGDSGRLARLKRWSRMDFRPENQYKSTP